MNSASYKPISNLTAMAVQSRLRLCARKNSHWMLSSICPTTQRCRSLPRSYTRQQFVRDWMNSTRARVSHTTKLSGSSRDGLQNNLVAASIGGPSRGRSVYSPRQADSSSTVWGKTHSKSGKSYDLSGARGYNQEVCRPESAASLSGTLPDCLSHTHGILINRNCSNLAWGSERREFRTVDSYDLPQIVPITSGGLES